MNEFLKMFSYSFVQRALIGGMLISICAALLGVILVLKNYSMMGHGLADVGFMSLSLGLALGLAPMIVSVPIVMAAAFVIIYLSQRKNIKGDIIIGMIATSSLAIGIIIISLSSGFSTNVRGFMFGSILALSSSDMTISVILCIAVITLFVIFYNKLFIITYDTVFARAIGIKTVYYQMLIAALTAMTVVVGMRMMGTLLISSLIIFPAMTGRTLARSFKWVVISSAIVSAVCFLTGMVITMAAGNIPAGAGIVLVNIVVFALAQVFKQIKNKTVKA